MSKKTPLWLKLMLAMATVGWIFGIFVVTAVAWPFVDPPFDAGNGHIYETETAERFGHSLMWGFGLSTGLYFVALAILGTIWLCLKD